MLLFIRKLSIWGLQILLFPFFAFQSKIVLFGCPKARMFTDNGKYLFQYFIKKNVSFPFFLTTKNKTLYQQLKKEYPKHVVYAYSLKGIITFLRAKTIIISHGQDDVFPFLLKKRHVVINLWHGTPIKKIGLLVNQNDKNAQGFGQLLNHFVVSSEFEASFMQKAFELKASQCLVTGTPRNDQVLFPQQLVDLKSFSNRKIILYVPTFRDDRETEYFNFPHLDVVKLHQKLKELNACILIKAHINEGDKQANQFLDDDFVRTVTNDDLPYFQEFLSQVDLILTDYSGIYFDYLLVNKPMMFLPYDIDLYEKERGFIFDYHENTPGKKVHTFQQFLEGIEIYLNNPKEDEEERLKIQEKFHKYTDGKASQRLLEKVTQIMN